MFDFFEAEDAEQVALVIYRGAAPLADGNLVSSATS
jgi:hypothetical protein